MRVARFLELESRNMQFVPQLGESCETNVVKWVALRFVKRACVAAEETAAKESNARSQGRDVWRGQYQRAAGFSTR